ncbi:MAG: PH domain-containing protein, partial [Haloferacaceae archaeon]
DRVTHMVADQEWFSPSTGEEVVWWGKPRLWRIWPTVARSGFWALVFIAVAVVGPRFTASRTIGLGITGVGVVLALASLRSAVMAYLETRNVYYVLTDRNVYRKTGVWSTTVTRVGVENVQNTRLSKDFWGERFDYGTVAISTAGSGGTDILFSDLRDPETCREQLLRLTGETRARSTSTGGAAALDSETVERVTTEMRALREGARRLESEVARG